MNFEAAVLTGSRYFVEILLVVFDMLCYNKMNYADNMLTGLPIFRFGGDL